MSISCHLAHHVPVFTGRCFVTRQSLYICRDVYILKCVKSEYNEITTAMVAHFGGGGGNSQTGNGNRASAVKYSVRALLDF